MGKKEELGFKDPKQSRAAAKRGQRAKDSERMKRKARKVYYFNEPGQAEKLADHLAYCSCMGCGGQRRYFGDTMQERRQLMKERFDAQDVD